MKITFLGATQQVTGSKYLLEYEDTKILVDCGLFQGTHEIRKHNWDRFPIDPHSIDAVVLTHGHLDHCGYLPLLVKRGFRGKIYCSLPTSELCAIILKDSGMVQEEEAKKANLYGYSRHKPALPLYTREDAEKTIPFLQPVNYGTHLRVGGFKIQLIKSNHILGSSFVVVSDGSSTITFSGDLGRPHQLMMDDPVQLQTTDFLVLESTYGDRLHETGHPIKQLGEIINATIARNGILIIPAFAVERTQTILYCLYQLRQNKVIPSIPVYLDSPMATNVTHLFEKFQDEHNLSPQVSSAIFSIPTYVQTIADSKRLDHLHEPTIIIAGSGMADGGRVLDHLTHYISDSKNTVLFVGYQAEGTHGQALTQGAQSIKIYGNWYNVAATIHNINIFSAHADCDEILAWISSFDPKPKTVFLTHGELQSSQALQKKIEEQFGWSVVIPKYLQSFDLNS